MGVAIAAAAWRRGADVTLIAGPLSVAAPVGVRHIAVQSTDDMRAAVAAQIGSADVVVMSAAPADYRPDEPSDRKLKKTGKARTLELTETTDILASTRDARKAGAIVVGFALETDDLLANARRKLEAKELDMIVLNDAKERGAGFGADTNRVAILRRGDGQVEQLPLLSKVQVADELLDRVEALRGGR
jgi:phosphopantothenoylcysteine decarboxylase/phosphopantothenate--cysteine ligase